MAYINTGTVDTDPSLTEQMTPGAGVDIPSIQPTPRQAQARNEGIIEGTRWVEPTESALRDAQLQYQGYQIAQRPDIFRNTPPVQYTSPLEKIIAKRGGKGAYTDSLEFTSDVMAAIKESLTERGIDPQSEQGRQMFQTALSEADAVKNKMGLVSEVDPKYIHETKWGTVIDARNGRIITQDPNAQAARNEISAMTGGVPEMPPMQYGKNLTDIQTAPPMVSTPAQVTSPEPVDRTTKLQSDVDRWHAAWQRATTPKGKEYAKERLDEAQQMLKEERAVTEKKEATAYRKEKDVKAEKAVEKKNAQKNAASKQAADEMNKYKSRLADKMLQDLALMDGYNAKGKNLPSHINYDTVGPVGYAKSLLPLSTEARLLKGYVKQFQASAAFKELQEMRAASKTGGALGQVSERELDLLMNSIQTLDRLQDPLQFQAAVNRIRENLNAIKADKVVPAVVVDESPQSSPSITTQEEYDSLPPNSEFTWNGRKGIKP